MDPHPNPSNNDELNTRISTLPHELQDPIVDRFIHDVIVNQLLQAKPIEPIEQPIDTNLSHLECNVTPLKESKDLIEKYLSNLTKHTTKYIYHLFRITVFSFSTYIAMFNFTDLLVHLHNTNKLSLIAAPTIKLSVFFYDSHWRAMLVPRMTEWVKAMMGLVRVISTEVCLYVRLHGTIQEASHEVLSTHAALILYFEWEVVEVDALRRNVYVTRVDGKKFHEVFSKHW